MNTLAMITTNLRLPRDRSVKVHIKAYGNHPRPGHTYHPNRTWCGLHQGRDVTESDQGKKYCQRCRHQQFVATKGEDFTEADLCLGRRNP